MLRFYALFAKAGNFMKSCFNQIVLLLCLFVSEKLSKIFQSPFSTLIVKRWSDGGY